MEILVKSIIAENIEMMLQTRLITLMATIMTKLCQIIQKEFYL